MSGGRERGWGQVRGVLEKPWGQKLEGLVTSTEEDPRCPWNPAEGRRDRRDRRDRKEHHLCVL